MLCSDSDVSKIFHATSDGEDVSLNYAAIPNLPAKIFDRLRHFDTDKNGEISLSEVVAASKTNQSLTRMVTCLVVILILLMGAMFAVSFAAAVLAQETSTHDNGVLVKKGSQDIVATREAKESVPLSFTSLLDMATLSRVKEIQMTNFYLPGIHTRTGCTPVTNKTATHCPFDMLIRVESVVKYNDTWVEFFAANGEVIKVNYGDITATDLPMFRGMTVQACASATCSSISVSGVDMDDLYYRASSYGFKGTSDPWKGVVVLPSSGRRLLQTYSYTRSSYPTMYNPWHSNQQQTSCQTNYNGNGNTGYSMSKTNTGTFSGGRRNGGGTPCSASRRRSNGYSDCTDI